MYPFPVEREGLMLVHYVMLMCWWHSRIEWSLVLEPDRLMLMGGKHYWHHSQFDRRRVCMMIWGVLIFTHIYRRHWRLLTGCSICHHSVVAMERERKMTPSYYLLSSAIRFYLVWEVHEFWKPMNKMWTRFLIFFSLRCKMQYIERFLNQDTANRLILSTRVLWRTDTSASERMPNFSSATVVLSIFWRRSIEDVDL